VLVVGKIGRLFVFPRNLDRSDAASASYPIPWGQLPHRHRSTTRRIKNVSVEEIISATAKVHQIEGTEYAKLRSVAAGRDMAAWLCRRWSGATLRQLGSWFGLDGTDSVSNLVRRAEARYKESSKWRRQAKNIEIELGLNTEHKD